MSDDTIAVCPNCDSSALYRCGTGVGRERAEGSWWCEDCHWRGDEYAERAPKRHRDTHHGPSRRLLDADPEDYPQ